MDFLAKIVDGLSLSISTASRKPDDFVNRFLIILADCVNESEA